MKQLLILGLLASLTGCGTFIGNRPPEITNPDSTNSTAAVIVTVERSYVGDNPGAFYDAWMMYDLLTNVTDDVTCLMNDQATKKKVKEAILKACQKELAIFYFSGHGGREYAWKDKTEEDKYDEYMILANTSITDNEMWDLISTSTNRVMLIFNCCHSETMYKVSPSNTNTEVSYIFPRPVGAKQINNDDIKFKMLCWSGCPDDGASYTSNKGGYFTQAINNTIKAFGKNVDYGTAWTVIQYSSTASKVQKPRKNIAGKWDETKPVFR